MLNAKEYQVKIKGKNWVKNMGLKVMNEQSFIVPMIKFLVSIPLLLASESKLVTV